MTLASSARHLQASKAAWLLHLVVGAVGCMHPPGPSGTPGRAVEVGRHTSSTRRAECVVRTMNNDKDPSEQVFASLSDRDRILWLAQKRAPYWDSPYNQAAVRLQLGVDPEYVLDGPLRGEMHFEAGKNLYVSRGAIELVVFDERHDVVCREEPSLRAINVERTTRADIDACDLYHYVDVTRAGPSVLPFELPADCFESGKVYSILARLWLLAEPPVEVVSRFAVRPSSTADVELHAALGRGPYEDDLEQYASYEDIRPALAIPLDRVATDNPWRGLILWAHVYGGPGAPEAIDPAVFERLATGAIQFSGRHLFEITRADSKDHSLFIRERRERLEAGPGRWNVGTQKADP